ncbi:MAG: porin, partial [Pseudomonadota bacterium]
KISYVTPRLLGVRGGVSFTPSSDVRGLDRNTTGSDVPPRAKLENVFEFGLNASRRLRESGVRLRAGLSYSAAEVEAPEGFEGVYEDRLDVFSAGGEIELQDAFRFGLNWISADEGLRESGDYTAWSAGLGFEQGDWRASVVYGESEIPSADAQADGLSIAVARTVNDYLTFGLSWQDRAVSPDVASTLERRAFEASSEGIVIEITLSFEK